MATQGYSSGGSINSARAQSYSNTAGVQASNTAQQQAAIANTTAKANWEATAKFNAEQARIQREWEERMANTVYQRTVKDMTAAGINPILAANMGLGTASVGSGATASMSTPQAFMGQTFAEQNSASTSDASGSSWQSSENGLMTLANAITSFGKSLIDKVNSAESTKQAEQAAEYWNNLPTTIKDFVNDKVTEDTKPISEMMKDIMPKNNTTRYYNYENKNKKAGDYLKWKN